MSQTDLLIEAVKALDRAGVGHVLTGSIVSSLQGEPRATHDIDLVIEVDVRAVDKLSDAFGAPRYFFDGIAAREALAHLGMFNLLDTSTGDKVDFWSLTESDFDRSRFARRVVTKAFGRDVYVTSPEDTILQKLKWSADSGGSERQMGDAQSVYAVQSGRLDEAYLDEWAGRLDVADLLARIRLAATRVGD